MSARTECNRAFLFDYINEERDDGGCYDILGDVPLCVISSHLFLVDVLFEGIAKNIGIDLVVVARWMIIQFPTVGIEEGENALKSLIGNFDSGGEVVALYFVFLEKVDIKERYGTKKGSVFGRMCLLTQTFVEEDQEEVMIEVEAYVLTILCHFQMV